MERSEWKIAKFMPVPRVPRHSYTGGATVKSMEICAFISIHIPVTREPENYSYNSRHPSLHSYVLLKFL